MRRQSIGQRYVNHEQLNVAIRAGQAGQILAGLRESVGLALDGSINNGQFYRGIFPRSVVPLFNDRGEQIGQEFGNIDAVAFDAQPELVTTMNSGIPAFLQNYLDPKVIEVLVSPMKAAEIAGETQKGNWVTATTQFIMVESDGEVSSYGDYNNGGTADSNSQFPSRQSFHYQTFTQWGEKELAVAGLAGIDLASRKNVASALVLNKFQNQTYFFGVAGLQNYGLLNDPDLPAAIVPTVTWNSATPDQILTDVIRLYQNLVAQANGLIDADARATLALSPTNALNLNKTNQFNVNVYDQISKNFPGIRIKTAPEYSTASGELVQLILDEFDGQETCTAAFTEKMRTHALVVESSSFKQKKSQGTWGTIVFRPVFFSQMLG